VALVVLDIAVSVVALLIAFALGLVALAFVTQLTTVSGTCGADPSLSCNPTQLGIAAYGLLAVTVLAFFLGFGFAIVRIIQKRYTFAWTVGALVVMLIAFYAASFIAGGAVTAL
jgi:hypothetical protein